MVHDESSVVFLKTFAAFTFIDIVKCQVDSPRTFSMPATLMRAEPTVKTLQ